MRASGSNATRTRSTVPLLWSFCSLCSSCGQQGLLSPRIPLLLLSCSARSHGGPIREHRTAGRRDAVHERCVLVSEGATGNLWSGVSRIRSASPIPLASYGIHNHEAGSMVDRDTWHSARSSNGLRIRPLSSFGHERSFFPPKVALLSKQLVFAQLDGLFLASIAVLATQGRSPFLSPCSRPGDSRGSCSHPATPGLRWGSSPSWWSRWTVSPPARSRGRPTGS